MERPGRPQEAPRPAQDGPNRPQDRSKAAPGGPSSVAPPPCRVESRCAVLSCVGCCCVVLCSVLCVVLCSVLCCVLLGVRFWKPIWPLGGSFWPLGGHVGHLGGHLATWRVIFGVLEASWGLLDCWGRLKAPGVRWTPHLGQFWGPKRGAKMEPKWGPKRAKIKDKNDDEKRSS